MKSRRIVAVSGFLLVVALYLSFAGNGFLYDDYRVVLEREPPASIGDLARMFGEPYYSTLSYYRPLSAATFAIQRGLLGDDPVSFHVVNAVLAGVAAGAAWLFLGLPRLEIGRAPALLAALLFAVHPVASSCALPVSGRDTLLAAIATLGSLYAFCRAGRGWHVAGLALFLVGLGSKETTVALPLLLLLADLCGMSESGPARTLRAVAARYLPLLVVLSGYFAIRQVLFPEFTHALGSPGDVALSYLYALQVTVAPFGRLLYEPLPAGWFSWWRTGIALLPLVTCAVVATRRPAARRSLGFWSGWFVLALLPSANLVWQETRFAERYVFLASLALPGIAATLVSSGLGRDGARRSGLAAGAVLIAICAAIVFVRGPYWEELAFYRQWVHHDPGNVAAHFNLARALEQRGRSDEARQGYATTLRLDAEHDGAHNNLGSLLARGGDAKGALRHLEESVRLNPRNHTARNNLGSALARDGRLDEAMLQFRAAIELRPDYAGAHCNLGHALALRGEGEQAMEHFLRALEIDPEHADAHYGVGIVLLSRGRKLEAVERFREALRLQPDHHNARVLLEQEGAAPGITAGPAD